MYYRAGQYINILMPANGQIRSYSLASLPCEDNFLELHIKRMNNGLLSSWLYNEVSVGDRLEIQGPYGSCYYFPEFEQSNMLMIGTGTGLAPLYGILRDAIASGHKGQIKLYHGVSDNKNFYLDKEINELIKEHSNIQYFPCSTSTDEVKQGVFSGRSSELAFQHHTDLKDYQVYLCGSPQMVDFSRIEAGKIGANPEHIYADPFATKDLRLLGDDRN